MVNIDFIANVIIKEIVILLVLKKYKIRENPMKNGF